MIDKAMGAAEKIYGVLEKLNKAQVDAAVRDLIGDLYQEFNSAVHPYIFRLNKENLELQDEIRGLKDEVQRLNEMLTLVGQMKYEAPYYWRVDKDSRDGPYCQKCWDVDRILVRLQNWGEIRRKCLNCETILTDPEDVWVRPKSMK